jgi:hypothetical protein
MKKIVRGLLAVPLAVSPVMGQEGRVVSESWMQRPEIRAIPELYRAVESKVGAGLYTTEGSKCFCGGEPVVAVLFADSAGVARKYDYQNVTPWAVVEARYYCDEAGRLRFMFQAVAAANGARRKRRSARRRFCACVVNDLRAPVRTGRAGGVMGSAVKAPEHRHNGGGLIDERLAGWGTVSTAVPQTGAGEVDR